MAVGISCVGPTTGSGWVAASALASSGGGGGKSCEAGFSGPTTALLSATWETEVSSTVGSIDAPATVGLRTGAAAGVETTAVSVETGVWGTTPWVLMCTGCAT